MSKSATILVKHTILARFWHLFWHNKQFSFWHKSSFGIKFLQIRPDGFQLFLSQLSKKKEKVKTVNSSEIIFFPACNSVCQ